MCDKKCWTRGKIIGSYVQTRSEWLKKKAKKIWKIITIFILSCYFFELNFPILNFHFILCFGTLHPLWSLAYIVFGYVQHESIYPRLTKRINEFCLYQNWLSCVSCHSQRTSCEVISPCSSYSENLLYENCLSLTERLNALPKHINV